jgi:nucleotide-binding universal stress UspA family protein
MPFEGKMRVAGVEDDMIRQHRDAARRDSLARLHQTATDAGLASARWLPIVLHGDAAPRILEQEEEMGADLIVLGKHGAGVAEELLLGSVTKHVLAQARCDVLVAQR